MPNDVKTDKTEPERKPAGGAQQKPQSEQATHQGGGSIRKDHQPQGPGAARR